MMLQNHWNHKAWKNFHVISIAIAENVVLNERRRINSFTSGIWKPTLRFVCQTFQVRSDVLALKQLISFISYLPLSSSLILLENW